MGCGVDDAVAAGGGGGVNMNLKLCTRLSESVWVFTHKQTHRVIPKTTHIRDTHIHKRALAQMK